MEEKDIEMMNNEELKEYTRKFYEQLEDKASCVTCPVEFCPHRQVIVNEESDSLESEE